MHYRPITVKLALALVAPLFMSACSVSAPVYSIARFDGEDLIFEGVAVGYMDRTGTIEMRSKDGVTCAGAFRYTGTRVGDGNLTCSNGEKANIQFNGLSTVSGYGYGSSSSGYPIAFTFGLDKGERERYLRIDEKFASAPSQRKKQTAAPKIVSASAADQSGQTSQSAFPSRPVDVSFRKSDERPNDIAVIIGNANYKKGASDIPNVTPAYADAEGIKRYFIQALGVKEGNIIYLKDATGSQMAGVFGNDRSHKGQLFNWVKPGISNVYVYYAGHGAPGGNDGSASMVPSDASAESIDLTGYSLSTLYSNLGKIPAKSTTVILEACFSGASQGGTLISNASPVYLKAKSPKIPNNITVISAGAANQMASWEEDKSHSLFTKYFLKGMSGEADSDPYGNGDGKVDYTELGKYLGGTMSYFSRRYYGRDQNAQIVNGG